MGIVHAEVVDCSGVKVFLGTGTLEVSPSPPLQVSGVVALHFRRCKVYCFPFYLWAGRRFPSYSYKFSTKDRKISLLLFLGSSRERYDAKYVQTWKYTSILDSDSMVRREKVWALKYSVVCINFSQGQIPDRFQHFFPFFSSQFCILTGLLLISSLADDVNEYQAKVPRTIE